MSKIIELFGVCSQSNDANWEDIIAKQMCPYTSRKCMKTRKSEASISIGTCSVIYSKENKSIIICPFRLVERKQFVTDCMHLLTLHEPGNELHFVPEISVPGGNIDYFLVSVRDKRVKDFVGIEIQTLDTTGTVWPERQKLLREKGLKAELRAEDAGKTFGMNWKMTAKTILIQLHHKVQTFENINKHIVLAIQDHFFDYMKKEFRFAHVDNVRNGDSCHIHAYNLKEVEKNKYRPSLASRYSTNAEGIAQCLGLKADAKVELEEIIKQISSKISEKTLFSL